MGRRAETLTDDELDDLKRGIKNVLGPFVDTTDSRDKFFVNNPLEKFLRERGLDINSIYAQLLSAVRAKHLLERFGDIFNSLIDNEEISDFLAYVDTGTQRGFSLEELFFTNEPVDKRITNKRDLVGSLLEVVLRDDFLSAQCMSAIDAYVKDATRANLEAIYQIEETGSIATTDVTIVGSGPTAVTAAILLSTVCKVTMIWDTQRLSSDWRSRSLLHINSTVARERPGCIRAPLVGNTTPISPNGLLTAPQLSELQSPEDLTVKCISNDNGTAINRGKRRYLRGRKIGEATAMQAAVYVENFLANQSVHLGKGGVTELENGDSIIEFSDQKTRKKGRLQQSLLLVMTGPGKEVCRIPGQNAQLLFAESLTRTQQIIQEVCTAYKKSRPYTYTLPKVLSLTTVQQLYDCWVHDLDRDLRYYPFIELQQQNITIGIVGGADTAFILSQFINGGAPRESYVGGKLEPDQIPQTTLYNVPQATPEDFFQEQRIRYSSVFSDQNKNFITTNPEKVAELLEQKQRKNPSAQIGIETESSEQFLHDFVFVSTGLDETDPSETFLPKCAGYFVQGNLVGRTNYKETIFALGTAAKFRRKELPDRIQSALNLLDIDANTVALWANIPGVERAIWNILKKFYPDQQHVNELIEFIRNQSDEVGRATFGKPQTIEELIRASVNPDALISPRVLRLLTQIDQAIEDLEFPLLKKKPLPISRDLINQLIDELTSPRIINQLNKYDIETLRAYISLVGIDDIFLKRLSVTRVNDLLLNKLKQ